MKQQFYLLATMFLLWGLIPNTALAQQVKKKVTIIEETTDANGNTTIKTTVTEGDNENINIQQFNDGARGNMARKKLGMNEMELERNLNVIEQDLEKLGDNLEKGVEKIVTVHCNMEPRAFLGIGGNTTIRGGLLISNIVEGSPANNAGLLKGDILYSIDDVEIKDFDDLIEVMKNYEVGDKVSVKYEHNQDMRSKEITLGKSNTPEVFTYNYDWNENDFNWHNWCPNVTGCSKPQPKAKLGVTINNTEDNSGAKVITITEKSAAEAAKLQIDDIIYQIDGVNITNTDDLINEVGRHNAGDKIMLRFLRNGKKQASEATLQANDAANIERKIIVKINKEGDNAMPQTIKIDENVEVFVIDGNVATLPVPNPTPIEEGGVTIGNANDDMVELSLFPNPTTNQITIQFKTADKTLPTVLITDVAGKEVYREEVITFTGEYRKDIDLKNNPSGTYLLTIKQGAKSYTEQVLLNK